MGGAVGARRRSRGGRWSRTMGKSGAKDVRCMRSDSIQG